MNNCFIQNLSIVYYEKITFFFMLFAVLNSSAQVKEITLQASGLTCSMCSKSIYKSLLAVSFVQDVQSDIKNSAFIITLKPIWKQILMY
jgi:3,4-dihydroxy-2-butanone 4-phosphate synthase